MITGFLMGINDLKRNFIFPKSTTKLHDVGETNLDIAHLVTLS